MKNILTYTCFIVGILIVVFGILLFLSDGIGVYKYLLICGIGTIILWIGQYSYRKWNRLL